MPTPFMYSGMQHVMPHPKPVRRKTSALDGYYKNGIPTVNANIGDTITYDVPGHTPGTVFLVQANNGQPGYRGPFTVPMAPYLLTVKDHTGLVTNIVYDKDPAQGGVVIETDQIYINQPTGPPSSTGPGGPVNAPCGYDANGNPIQYSVVAGTGQINCPPVKATATPPGTPPPVGPPSVTSSPTTVTTGGPGGTPGGGTPGGSTDNTGTLILVAAAVALFLVAGGK